MNNSTTNRRRSPGKLSNPYQLSISRRLYARTPKAVFAALAVSPWHNRDRDDSTPTADAAILAEWEILFTGGLVPQRPPSLRPWPVVELT